MGGETEYDDDAGISQRNAQQGAQVIQIDSGKHVALVAVCAALCGFSCAVSAWSAYQASITAKETRLTQYYLMDPHSRTPEELASWAKFNREHEEK